MSSVADSTPDSEEFLTFRLGEQGEGYIRFSYANSIANIEQAVERIRGFLER
jgi:aspartate/methionine/tyrosine aminotransferase